MRLQRCEYRAPTSVCINLRCIGHMLIGPVFSRSLDSQGVAPFGEVVEGMDIVDKMTLVDTGRLGHHDDVPKEEIIITETVIEAEA